MQGGEDLGIEELVSNLSTYKEQLQQVRKLLVDDPGNSEYADMEKELEEVIVLTEELFATAKQSEFSGPETGSNANVPPHQRQYEGTSQYNMVQLQAPSLL